MKKTKKGKESKLSAWALKRESLLRKMELVIAELDYVKRQKKDLEAEMQGHDNYLLRELCEKQ